MEWSLDHADHARQEVAAADHPRIRLFSVPHVTATEPKDTVEASWEVCDPKSAAEFSAVGYFFGRELQRELGIPIGLIDSSWGGTVAEAWTSAGALEALGDFEKALAQVRAEKAEAGKPPVKFDRGHGRLVEEERPRHRPSTRSGPTPSSTPPAGRRSRSPAAGRTGAIATSTGSPGSARRSSCPKAGRARP